MDGVKTVYAIVDAKYGITGLFKDKKTARESLNKGGWLMSAYKPKITAYMVIQEPEEGPYK